jgi:hypothetical protein
MNKRKLFALVILVILLFLLVGNVLAMSSPAYMLEWYVPVTSGGAGEASSATYSLNLTVGQSVIGSSSSSNFGNGFGYWYGLLLDRIRVLPIILKWSP